jgi:hypothetical protein
MATLKLPPGRKYVPKPQASNPPAKLVRRGHASASTFYDQFRKHNKPELKSPDSTVPIPILLAHEVFLMRRSLSLRPDKTTLLGGRTIDQSRLKPRKARTKQQGLSVSLRERISKILGM